MEQGSTLVIGGAEDKVNRLEILQTFWRRAGGEQARLGDYSGSFGGTGDYWWDVPAVV
jgi:cyanophycinase-like exopeptidase